MAYEVRNETVDGRVLAAVHATLAAERIAGEIRRLLGDVWTVLRAQGVRTGHNVAVYRPASDGAVECEFGVETFSPFEDRDPVRRVETPSGEVASTAHFGEYSGLGGAYDALEEWCRTHDRRPAGVNWEVYGDWSDDPAEVRTDVVFLLAPA